MKATLDHIGIAVASLDEALSFYRDALGLEVEAPEDVPSQRVRATFIRLDPSKSDPTADSGVNAERGGGAPAERDRGTGAPGVKLELLEATADDSPIAKYLQKRGPGLHHITLRVADVAAALEALKARGVRLIDDAPRPGAHGSLVAFIHPASTGGVLIELKQVG